jgi:hypothetical protein
VDARSQNLHIHLDAERIVEARERAAAARSGTTAVKEASSALGPKTVESDAVPAVVLEDSGGMIQ